MASKAAYTLLPFQRRSNPWDGPVFPTVRRTDWRLTIRHPVVTSSTVKVQASPHGTSDDDFEDRHEVTVSSSGTTEVAPDGLDTAFTGADVWIRAVLSSESDTSVLECVARAPFFDSTDKAGDVSMLQKKIREHPDLTPIVERAESTVLARVLGQRDNGALDGDLVEPLALDLIKQAIAIQVDLEYRRTEAMQSDEAAESYLSSGARFPLVAEGVRDVLEPILPAGGTVGVWRGR